MMSTSAHDSSDSLPHISIRGALRWTTMMLIVLATLGLSGCFGGQRYTIAPDGSWIKQTPENMRNLHQRDWVEDITQDHLSAIRISELPADTADYIDEISEWVYADQLTITLLWQQLPTDDSTRQQTEAALQRQAERHMQPSTTLVFHHELYQAPAATSAGATSESSPATTAAVTPATSKQSYIIAEGDTLAGISAAFYGSGQHWRSILDANPGLAPDQLVVGERIIIPAKP